MIGGISVIVKNNGLYQFLQHVDSYLYRFLKQVKCLSRRQRQILLCLVVLSLVACMSLINGMVDNNAAWVEGSWSNKSVLFSFKAKNDHCKVWNIKKEDQLLTENVLIAVNSTRKNIVLAKSGNTIEYHLTKLNKKQIELRIVNQGKEVEKIRLRKDKKTP
ncbi:hypothetical protein [Enterococcus gilvus]|uniref:hypothetical protein n=1 Tax=Enterococcus gilvus TaxID=160453 RepID=UPI001114DB63|nr:hypothetical protein [Enterococcus gilvus]